MNRWRIIPALALMCAAGLLLPTCLPPLLPPPDGCTPTTTRCNGQKSEICDGASRWTTIEDCAQVGMQSGGTWTCCAVKPALVSQADAGVVEDHICVPQQECPGGSR